MKSASPPERLGRFHRTRWKGRRRTYGPASPSLQLEPLERRQMLSVGPALLSDLNPGLAASSPSEFVEVGGTVFFVADDGTHGRELWKTDGTASGTAMVKDLFPGSRDDSVPNSSSPQGLTKVGGTLFFTANGINGVELFKSDGTASGTLIVKDVFPGSTYQDYYGDVANSSFAWNLTDIDGTLFFTADDGVNGEELWKSDGTASGTVMVKDLYPGSGPSYDYYTGYSYGPFSSKPKELTSLNGTLFFTADDGANGEELFKSDGTAGGTVLVKDIFPGSYDYYPYGTYPYSSEPGELTPVDGTLYFTADDGLGGRELWKSDGTNSGTVMVKDLFPNGDSGPNSSDPQELTDAGGVLFFTADDGLQGRELFTSDGTASGTMIVKDIFPGSGSQYDYYSGYTYGPNSSAPQQLTNIEGVLFFTAEDDAHGRELFKSDGTAAGTVLVKDIEPQVSNGYPDGSYPDWLTDVGGTLHFTANDGTNGREVWMSDGTALGTFMVGEVYSGPADSQATSLASAGGLLYFSGDDGNSGLEPWTLEPITADQYGTIGGVAFDDRNADGTRDAGDPGLEGVTVFIDSNDNWKLDEAEVSAVTDVDGRYSFLVPPGTYELRQQVPAGMIQTAPLDPDTDPTSHVVSVDFAGEVTGLDFGSYALVPPAVVDLLPASDTGLANDDDLTRLNNATSLSVLQFQVSGIADGAWVRVFADGTQVASALSSTGPINVTTFGEVPLADGIHQITATQTVYGMQSGSSEPLMLSIDTVGPAGITTSAPTEAQVGQPYDYDVDSPDEGTSGVTYILAEAPDGATIDADGVVAWTPTEDQMGPQSLEIRVTDAAGNYSAEVAEVLVLGALPARADSYDVDEDHMLVVDGTDGVLANDGDASTGLLMATLLVPPSHGTLDFQADGSFSYVPEADFFGEDRFTYRASDGTDDSNEAPVTIVVKPVNDPPVADDDAYTTAEDDVLEVTAAGGVLADDVDNEDDALTAVLLGQPVHGTLTLNPDGSFTYQPQADFFGTDAFTYRANDGELNSQPATVTITVTAVNDPPAAVADAYDVDEDDVLIVDAAEGLLANDSDVEGNLFTAALAGGPANGILDLDDDGSFTYTPRADFFGTDSFTYRAADAAGQSPATTVTINVLGRPDPPVARDDQFEVTQDSDTTVLDVLENDDTEPDGEQTLRVIDVSAGSARGTIGITADAEGVEYTPAAGFVGTETFDYTIEDADGLTDQATATVEVTEFLPDSSISGAVYCDTDDDGLHDAGEVALPGVVVTLTGVDDKGTAVSRALLTAADGSYSFQELLPGTYQVTQTQPAAMLDGKDTIGSLGGSAGDDQLSGIVLTGDSHSTENNFGEGRLRPEFVSLRLFLASTPSPEEYLPELMAEAEEAARNTTLAAAIRQGATEPPSGPFLEAIPEIQTTADTPATFQLTAIDVEGDPVVFSAIRRGDVDYSYDVDSQTGLVTVTPPLGFVGEMEIDVRVGPATSSGTSDPYDSQLVRIHVASASAALSDTALSEEEDWLP